MAQQSAQDRASSASGLKASGFELLGLGLKVFVLGSGFRV